MRLLQLAVFQGSIKLGDLYIVDDGKEILYGDSLKHNVKLEANWRTVNTDLLLMSWFDVLLKDSDVIRAKFMDIVMQNRSLVLVKVNVVRRSEVMDKRGSGMFEHLALERREVDHAMAWFSTLGGAFSALGDGLEHCAKMAGKISVQQFNLALRLNDPFLVARCRLYLALSLIQQRCFREAKRIILAQYAFAARDNYDPKLVSMCRGIAAKWKYDRQQHKQHLRCIK